MKGLLVTDTDSARPLYFALRFATAADHDAGVHDLGVHAVSAVAGGRPSVRAAADGIKLADYDSIAIVLVRHSH